MEIALTSPMLESIRTQRPSIGEEIAANGDGGAVAGFADTLHNAITQVDAQQHAASDQVAAVETGDSDDLVGAMLASQQASLSFSMMIQVRNKMMNAFDDIIKMQV
jgi:flagellar hook-basal body complex protein FliE